MFDHSFVSGHVLRVCVRTVLRAGRWNTSRENQVPKARHNLAQHGAEGGVLGWVVKEPESLQGRHVLTHSEVVPDTNQISE